MEFFEFQSLRILIIAPHSELGYFLYRQEEKFHLVLYFEEQFAQVESVEWLFMLVDLSLLGLAESKFTGQAVLVELMEMAQGLVSELVMVLGPELESELAKELVSESILVVTGLDSIQE